MSTYVVNLATAPDHYDNDPVITFGVAGVRRIEHAHIRVQNQGIFRQFQFTGFDSPPVWEDAEVFLAPGNYGESRRNLTGIRFRAAIPLASLPVGVSQAIVSLEVFTP